MHCTLQILTDDDDDDENNDDGGDDDDDEEEEVEEEDEEDVMIIRNMVDDAGEAEFTMLSMVISRIMGYSDRRMLRIIVVELL
ncbi:hypothetical protein DPMN_073424 [Dreissena polymorpha]|uniref:Uncharacterized protein n=1 Tax=Dreissena polymorpha TaxID=45954 RepID=A0A9D4BZ06_DREPO|nr:hypothetical protein DPMN_073424 [Dreissena polymorpha]